MAMQQVPSRAATCLENKCCPLNARHTVSILLQQAGLLAQLSCHCCSCSFGTTAKTKRLQSRYCLAATLGLNGSALDANGNGKRASETASAAVLVVPSAVERSRVTSGSPLLLKPSLPVWLVGDYERNDAKGFYPDKVTLGSHKPVHWICSCCPRGQPHRWTASPYTRVGHGKGCPVCAGKQACVCISLESLFPSVAADFDTEENGFAPSELTAGSNKEVWWSSAKCGSWRQAVYHCTRIFRTQVTCCSTVYTASICS